MKEVTQLVTGSKGTCWTACLASILELEHDEVPRFIDLPEDKNFYLETNDWLRKNHGVSLVGINLKPFRTAPNKISNPFYFCGFEWPWTILCGESPRNPEWSHAVVGRGHHPVWDPHPDRNFFIGTPTDMFIFVGIYEERTQ